MDRDYIRYLWEKWYRFKRINDPMYQRFPKFPQYRDFCIANLQRYIKNS